MTIQELTIHIDSLVKGFGFSGEPVMDSRADLVRCYGHSLEEVVSMSEDEVFEALDCYSSEFDGYDYEEFLPLELQKNRCSCGGEYKVLYVDCETRGDCEIYVCECKQCNSKNEFAYAEEWYTGDFE